jgi:hypothetical protein
LEKAMDIDVQDVIQEMREDIKDIKKVLMGKGDTNPHGGLVGKVIKIETRQKIIIAILSAIGLASLGLVFAVLERILIVALP